MVGNEWTLQAEAISRELLLPASYSQVHSWTSVFLTLHPVSALVPLDIDVRPWQAAFDLPTPWDNDAGDYPPPISSVHIVSHSSSYGEEQRVRGQRQAAAAGAAGGAPGAAAAHTRAPVPEPDTVGVYEERFRLLREQDMSR